MDSSYTRELEVAIAALQTASKLSQHIINSTDKGVVQKEDLSPVTVADFAIQALLAATIRKNFPNDKVVGEENASQLRGDLLLLEHVFELLRWSVGYGQAANQAAGGQKSKGQSASGLVATPETREKMCNLIDECGTSSPAREGRTWVFDPIDGTKTYVRGELYAINVALLVDGKQTVGVVGCPNMAIDAKAPLSNADIDTAGQGCVLFAVRDHGAYIRPMHGDTEPRKLPQHNQDLSLTDVRLVTSALNGESALPGIHELIAEKLNTPFPGCDLLPWVLRWVGLALNLGNTTVWVYKKRERRGKIWDHAGAMLLFEEAGGKVSDIHGKAIDLTAGRNLSGNFGFVAAPGELHGKVLELVMQSLREGEHTVYLE